MAECLNGGSCLFDKEKDGFACSCNPQWSGEKCELGKFFRFFFVPYNKFRIAEEVYCWSNCLYLANISVLQRNLNCWQIANLMNLLLCEKYVTFGL